VSIDAWLDRAWRAIGNQWRDIATDMQSTVVNTEPPHSNGARMLVSTKMNATRLGCIVVGALALASGCGAKSSLHDAASLSTPAGGGGGGGDTTSSAATGGAGGSASPLCAWSERFGDTDRQDVTSMAVDASNAIYVAGQFKGAIDFGDQTIDSQAKSSESYGPAFLTKLDPSGTPLWSKVLGAPADVFSASVAIDPAGNVILALVADEPVDFGNGPLQPNAEDAALVAKLDPDGNALWSRNLLAPDPEVFKFWDVAVAADGEGNIVVSGTTGGYLPNMVVAKLDPDGNDVWSHAFIPYGGTVYHEDTKPVFDAQGNVTIALHLHHVLGDYVYIDFGGGPVIANGAGGVVVVKFDVAGNHIYSRLLDQMEGFGFPDGYYVWPTPVAGTSEGEIFISTYFVGTVDLGLGPLGSAPEGSSFVAKLDAAGNVVWNGLYGDHASTGGLALAPDGRVLLTGYLAGSVDFGGGLLENTSPGLDVFVAALDGASGAHRMSRLYESSVDAYALAPKLLVAADAAGAPILAGDLQTDLTFCGDTLISAGEGDIFVAKLAP
jgi:hypothetical protein